MFEDAIRKSSTLWFESWTTDRKPVNRGREFQLDIGSAPLNLKAAHQTTQRIDLDSINIPPANTSNNTFRNRVYDIVCEENIFAENDGFGYPKNPKITITQN